MRKVHQQAIGFPLAPTIHPARRLKQQNIIHAPVDKQRVQCGLVKAGQQLIHHHNERVVNLLPGIRPLALAAKLTNDGILVFAAIARRATGLALFIGVQQQHRTRPNGVGVLHEARIIGQLVQLTAQQLLIADSGLDGMGCKHRFALAQRTAWWANRHHRFGCKHQSRTLGNKTLAVGVLVNLVRTWRAQRVAGLQALDGFDQPILQMVLKPNHVLDWVQNHPLTDGLRHGVRKIRCPANVVARRRRGVPLAKAGQNLVSGGGRQADDQVTLRTLGADGAPLVKYLNCPVV